MRMQDPLTDRIYAYREYAQAFIDSARLDAVVEPCATTQGWKIVLRPRVEEINPRDIIPVDDILDEAKCLTSSERGRDYGHPLDNFTQIAELWNVYLGKQLGAPISARQVAWMMIMVKGSRDANTPKRDNLVDTAGYARCAQLAEDEAVRRKEAK